MRRTDKLRSIVKDDGNQVFLLSCPACLPFSLAVHQWFVVNKSGQLFRWEVGFQKSEINPLGTHLYRDRMEPFDGIEIFPYFLSLRWNAKLVAVWEDDDYSTATKMIDFIESSPTTYPYRSTYFLTGPNSNSYVQWILSNFENINFTLPIRAIGKNYPFSSNIPPVSQARALRAGIHPVKSPRDHGAG